MLYVLEGIDWLNFWDWLIHWAQWATTLAVCGLILVACLCFFIDRGKMVACGLIVMVILVMAVVFNEWGIQILSPEVYAFFEGIFG